MVEMQKEKKKNSGTFGRIFGAIKKKPKVLPECMQTVQASIPIHAVHEKYGLIETYPGCYTKTYAIENINYTTASESEQDAILTKWRAFLNSIGTNMEMQLTLLNRSVNLRQFEEEVLLKETGDGYDHLRREMNKVILSRIMDGKNGIERDQYITLSVHADDVKKAAEVFKRLDTDVDTHLKAMQSSAKPVPIEERLEILHDIYNPDNRGEFLVKTKLLGADGKLEEVSSFDFENIRSMGIGVNDVIAPSSLIYRPRMVEIGTQKACVLRIMDLPHIMSDDFLTKITNQSFNMITTLNVKPLSGAETDALINRQIAGIREEKNNAQRRNRAQQVDDSMLSPELLDREEAALKMRKQIRENDEHLFETTITAIIFAEDAIKLKEYTDTVITECKGDCGASCEVLTDMQEEGFIATLPLCCNPLPEPRTLKSSSVTVMIPFSNLEIRERDGINYTLNANSKNLIVFNRENKANYNAFILGSSGSGKSFAAKNEIVNVYLAKDADIMIIDPEQEYIYAVSQLGGQVIPIMPGGQCHLNPLDISSLEYNFDGVSTMQGEVVDPILEKVSFIMKLFETMVHKAFGMDSIQKTLIDECLRDLYSPFMKDGRLYRAPSREETPTLDDMMHWLASCEEPEARELYFTLRRYAGNGTLNIFSQKTNVEIRNRIVCFDISSVGDELTLMAMTVVQDQLWSRLVENRRIGRFSYIYVDEIHLFFADGNESSAEFLSSLFKRCRKYNGAATGITQNPADMLEHPIGKKLLSESNLIQVLNQSDDENRRRIQSILNLSDSALDYITSAPQGQGLFYTGSNTVPFFSRFPKTNADGTPNLIYPLLTSNAKELLEIKERERRQKMQEREAERKSRYM